MSYNMPNGQMYQGDMTYADVYARGGSRFIEATQNIPADTLVNTDKVPKVTSIEEILAYRDGAIIELPGFVPDKPFFARVKRPSLMALASSGKIPNSLMSQATDIFAKGANAMVGTNSTVIKDVYDVVKIVCSAALVEPSMKQLNDNGIELTDEQLMAIFSYTQEGIKALERFFPK